MSERFIAHSRALANDAYSCTECIPDAMICASPCSLQISYFPLSSHSLLNDQ